MAKSVIALPNGTTVTVEGSVEEVAQVLSFYNDRESVMIPTSGVVSQKSSIKKNVTKLSKIKSNEGVDILTLVNATKDSENFEQIEQNILDKASQVDRVLLPLYIAGEKSEKSPALTSNDIYLFLKEFGINMALPNISNTLSGTATKYVMGDSTRKQGTSTGYKISRRGCQYIEQIFIK